MTLPEIREKGAINLQMSWIRKKGRIFFYLFQTLFGRSINRKIQLSARDKIFQLLRELSIGDLT